MCAQACRFVERVGRTRGVSTALAPRVCFWRESACKRGALGVASPFNSHFRLARERLRCKLREPLTRRRVCTADVTGVVAARASGTQREACVSSERERARKRGVSQRERTRHRDATARRRAERERGLPRGHGAHSG